MTEFKPKTYSLAACAALLINCAPAFAGNLDDIVIATTPAPVLMPAPQANKDYYVSLFAGTNQFADIETDLYGSEYSVDTDSGFVVGLTFGRRISDTLRVEGELSFASGEADSFSYSYEGPPSYYDSGDASGDIDATYLLLNVWYDVPTSGPLGYYVGGGLGLAKLDADTSWRGGRAGYGPSETAVAGQIGAGVIYDISDTLAIDFGYRFKATGRHDFDDNFGGGGYEDATVQSHSLQVGLTYNL